MIAVLGGTGNVGAPLVAQLAAKGQKVRVATRDASKKLPAGAQAIVGNLGEELYKRLFDGADALFLLVSPLAGPGLESQAIALAKQAGVKRVVKLSTIGASDAPQGLGAIHRAHEKELEASGMQWTMLRPGFFMTNVLAWVPEARATGAVRYNTGDGVMYPIAPSDIAAVGVAALTSDGHAGKYYALTGEEPQTAAQQIATMAQTWGRKIEAIANTPEQALEALRKLGRPEPLVQSMSKLWEDTRNGKVVFHTDTARAVLGRAPITFSEWCAANLPAL